MRTLKKALRTATVWKQDLYKFLRIYRATPHCTTGVAPATALYGRSVCTRLPESPNTNTDDQIIRERDTQQKQKMKAHADARSHAKPSTLQVGDSVLVKDSTKKGKLVKPFIAEPYTIVNKKGSLVTASNGQSCVTRNSSHFKAFDSSTTEKEPDGAEFADTSPQMPMSPLAKDRHRQNIPRENFEGIVQEPPRYPQRERKTPSYLKDYVSK